MARLLSSLVLLVFSFLAIGLIAFPGETDSHQADLDQGTKPPYREYFQIRKLWASKNAGEALSRCRKFIERNPDFNEIYPVFAQISRENGRLEEAVEFFHQLMSQGGQNAHFPYGLGLCYRERQDLARAAEAYKKAIAQSADFIWAYYNLVDMSAESEWAGLEKYFQEEIALSPENSFLPYGLGALYEFKIKEYDLALTAYERALQTAAERGRPAEETKHLNTIGNFYWGRGKYPKALEYYERALKINEKTRDTAERARLFYNCGLMNCYLGNVLKGRVYYFQALESDRAAGHRVHEAQSLRGIGFTFHRRSEYPQALTYYEQAIRLAQELGDRRGEGRYLADMASVYWERGYYQEAIATHKKALGIARETGDRYAQGTTLQWIGGLHWTLGDFSRALEYLIEAQKVCRELDIKERVASCLNDLGLVYQDLGDGERSRESYLKSLKIYREIGAKYDEGMCLNNIGKLSALEKKYDESERYLRHSLALAREIGNKRQEAGRLNNLSELLGKTEKWEDAIVLADEAFKIASGIGYREGEAISLLNKGCLFLRWDDQAQAIFFLQQALSAAHNLGLPAPAWRAHLNLGRAYERLGQPAKALDSYKGAIEVIENVRARLPLQEQQSAFFGSKLEVYERTVNLLFALHRKHPQENFGRDCISMAEKARARAFLDGLEKNKISLRTGLTPEQREEEIRISKEISGVQTDLLKPELEESRKSELFESLAAAEDRYKLFIQKMRTENPECADLVYPETASVQDVQERLLDDETAVVEYWFGEEKSYLFCITKERFSIHGFSDGRAVQEKAGDYIKLLSAKGEAEFRSAAAGQSLFRELIGPIEHDLAGKNRLIIAPDGILHYLPFEALVQDGLGTDPGEKENEQNFLVERFRISYVPSVTSLLSLLERRRPERPAKVFLAFANPLYSLAQAANTPKSADEVLRDHYLGQEFQLQPLPFSEEEVKKISRSINKESRTIYARAEATEEKLKTLHLQDFRIIHFATHGLLDEKAPLRSSLVLTLDQDLQEDGFFQVREIIQAKWNADLVVLSACQTGKGKLERGEGVTGMSRAFLSAGAQSVLVSLWNINDRTSAEFMGSFYEFLGQGKAKDDALRLAKLKMIGSKYRHPFYWAAFVLAGDSRTAVALSK